MDVVLEADRLGKRYGRTWALRDCSLHLPEGRIAALVGPNGAGKTTLLHLAVGLLRPDTGSVRVFGEPPYDNTAILAEVGFVAQDTPLYRDFTALDLLTMGAKLNRRWDSALARGVPRSRSRWHWRNGPGCCCSTNPWPVSTRWPGGSSSRRSWAASRNPARPSCCRHICWPTSNASATT
jgi:ABC-type sugar transport system ATPase subunit